VSRYRFVEAEKVEERSVNRACAVLEVSRAAYYEWRKQAPSARAQQDQELAEKVKAIFCLFTADVRGTPGTSGTGTAGGAVFAQAGGQADA
jgi:hypothetical protein